MSKPTICQCGCGQEIRAGTKMVKGHYKRGTRLDNPNPSGFCMCGCGEKTKISPLTVAKRNIVIGKPVRYISGHHRRTHGPGFPPGIDAKYDPEDEPLITCRSWLVTDNGYLSAGVGGKQVYLHRLITGAKKGEQVDHINGDRLDNRRCNLRVVDAQTNSQNLGIKSRNGARSGYRGVHWFGNMNKWGAVCKKNGVQYCLGYFSDKEEAAKIIHEWRMKNTPGYLGRA